MKKIVIFLAIVALSAEGARHNTSSKGGGQGKNIKANIQKKEKRIAELKQLIKKLRSENEEELIAHKENKIAQLQQDLKTLQSRFQSRMAKNNQSKGTETAHQKAESPTTQKK